MTNPGTPSKLQRVGRYEPRERELFVLEAARLNDVEPQLSLPCPYFACLLVMDGRNVSDDDLFDLATRLFKAGCVYICCCGPDCSRVHDCFDVADIALRPEGPWAMSTWHPEEPLSETIWFLLELTTPVDEYKDGCQAVVAVTIGEPQSAAVVRAALAAPTHHVGPREHTG